MNLVLFKHANRKFPMIGSRGGPGGNGGFGVERIYFTQRTDKDATETNNRPVLNGEAVANESWVIWEKKRDSLCLWTLYTVASANFLRLVGVPEGWRL